MRFRISRIQKAAVVGCTFIGFFISANVRAQRSFCETYLRSDLYSGVNDVERKNEESAVLLFERRVIEFRFENESLKEYEVIHRKFKVFDEKALKELSELYVPMGRVDEIVFMKAKATSPLGEVTETDMSKIKSVEEDGDQYKLLAVEGVQVNGTVEIIYGLRKSPNIYRSYYLGGNNRILESEYWMMSPVGLSMDHHVFNTTDFTKTDSTTGKDDSQSKLTIFKFNKVPSWVSLGKTFPNTPLKYRVESSLRRNSSRSNGINYEYNDIARLTFDVINKEKEAGQKEIKKIASKIDLSTKTTEREKIIEIESYVKMNYKKINAGQIQGANSIKFLNANKMGTDDAIATLYSGLFDFFGIKHEMGFAFDRSVKFVGTEFENWANLEEWVFRFPNSDTYILPMDPGAAPGYLNNDYRGTNMIRIKTLKVGDIVSAVSDLVMIPEGEQARQKELIKITLDSDFAPTGKYEYSLGGARGATLKWLRDLTFEEPGVFTSIVKSLVEARYEEQKTKNITYRFGDDYGAKDFTATVIFSGVPEELVEKAGSNYIFYPGKYYQSNFTTDPLPKDYANPVQAKEATFTEFEMEIPVPEGYKAELPKEPVTTTKVDFGDGRTLTLEIEFKNEGDKVRVFIREDQKLGRIEGKDLPKLNEYLEALRKVEKIYFVISKA